MAFIDEIISVGNHEKGYALFNKTTGEFMSDFVYSNIVNTSYGLHFLYKGENQEDYIIVDKSGKEVVFDKNYFWGLLGRSPLGVGCVVGKKDNKFYLANCKGQILSKGFDRRLLAHSASSRIYEATNDLKDSGRKFVGLIAMDGTELVPCNEEYIQEYDDVFVLSELIEKYGYGLIKYASEDILASDMIFIKLLEAAVKSLRTIPDFVNNKDYVMLFAQEGITGMYYLRLELCFEKGIIRTKAELDAKETHDKFVALVDKLLEEGLLINRIMADYLKKQIDNVLERLLGRWEKVFIFD